MKRLNLVTLGVKDLKSSRDFYCGLFDWVPAKNSDENIAFFNMGGYLLALFPWDHLAEDVTVASAGSGFRGVTLAHTVRDKADVATILSRAQALGAKVVKPAQDVFWGGHSGYFADPNGHLWEVAFNPFLTINSDGTLAAEK